MSEMIVQMMKDKEDDNTLFGYPKIYFIIGIIILIIIITIIILIVYVENKNKKEENYKNMLNLELRNKNILESKCKMLLSKMNNEKVPETIITENKTTNIYVPKNIDYNWKDDNGIVTLKINCKDSNQVNIIDKKEDI